ncbi:hypothetical protein [Dissulfurispira sp.]|uniref:hypothetical protein n=1 Tax=Dissulfurispira sp. TaxID=2817609 RepID=UPI002FDA8907
MQSISESINLPVSEVTAFKVLSDLNVILRLSPYWSLKELKPLTEGPVEEGSRYEATIEYYGKEVTETHGLEVIELLSDKKISFKVEEGILKEISFNIEKDSDGIRLAHRFLIDSDDEAILKGTRSELVFWLRSVGEYLKLAEGKTLWKKFFKWFMDRVWLRLTLSERKIAIIVTKISILELVLLLILVLAWNLFKSFR